MGFRFFLSVRPFLPFLSLNSYFYAFHSKVIILESSPIMLQYMVSKDIWLLLCSLVKENENHQSLLHSRPLLYCILRRRGFCFRKSNAGISDRAWPDTWNENVVTHFAFIDLLWACRHKRRLFTLWTSLCLKTQCSVDHQTVQLVSPLRAASTVWMSLFIRVHNNSPL